MSDTALVRSENGALQHAGSMGRQDIELLKATIAKGCSDGELRLFALVCEKTQLDPWARQIYAIKRSPNEAMIIHISVDGLRLAAARSGLYAGCVGPQWAGRDMAWRDAWLDDEPPAVARFGVLGRGDLHPTWGIATWRECAVKDGRGNLGPLWKARPAHMLGLRAEGYAFRRRFPAETVQLLRDATAAAAGEARVQMDTATGEVIDTELDPADEPLNARRDAELCADLYRQLGGDPGEKARWAADANRTLGRPEKCKDALTPESWRALRLAWQGQVDERQRAGTSEAVEVADEAHNPFADAATREAVARAEVHESYPAATVE